MRKESVQIPIEKRDAVSGALAIPENWRPGGTAAIFAHGAANDMNHPLLVSVAESFAEAGCLSLRFNFLYRELGKKSVDTERRLSLAWDRAIGFLKNRSDLLSEKVVAVGKSLGGRIASQMASEGTLPAEGLIFLGYPLHAPGKTDRLRKEHLGRIGLPMLFFSGTRDPFGEAALMKRTVEALSEATLEVVPDGDHSLGLPKTAAANQKSVYRGVAASALDWLRRRNLL
jgi:predicted alpha/beta-hydrolase family hydrolase